MVKLRPYVSVAPLLLALAVFWWIDGRWQFLLLLGCGACFFGALCATFANERIRSVCLSIAAVMLALAGLELFLRVTEVSGLAIVTDESGYRSVDGPLGTAPSGPGKYRSYAVEPESGDVIYDVDYTIGQHGFRETRGGEPGADTYLFFGGSLTYGHGVQDDETYAARFSEARGFRDTVVNVSFGGYGPHQMLRALEVGIPDLGITGPVRHTFYLALAGHVDRAVGSHWWNLHSPRYAMNDSGDIAFVGSHDDHWPTRLFAHLDNQGGLQNKFAKAASVLLHPTDARVDLAARMIDKSRQIVEQKYASSFTCLLWDHPKSLADDPRAAAAGALVLDELEEELRRRSVRVVRVSELLDDFFALDFRMWPGVENHPNAAAHQMLGHALARYIRNESLVTERQ